MNYIGTKVTLVSGSGYFYNNVCSAGYWAPVGWKHSTIVCPYTPSLLSVLCHLADRKQPQWRQMLQVSCCCFPGEEVGSHLPGPLCKDVPRSLLCFTEPCTVLGPWRPGIPQQLSGEKLLWAFSEISYLGRTCWGSLRAGSGQDTCRSISTYVVTCVVSLPLVHSPASCPMSLGFLLWGSWASWHKRQRV